MSKRIVAALLCGLLAVGGLTSCGGQKSPVGSDLTASTGETGPVPTGENSAVSSDGDILVPDDTPTSPITQKPENGKTKATQKVTTTTAKPMTYTKTKQDTMFESARGSSILLFYGGSLSDNEKKVAAEFTKQYGITIKYETMGWAEYNAKIAQRVAAGNPPDSAVMTDASALNFMYGNIAQPLNKYMDTADPYWNWNPSILKQYSIGDKIYAVPDYGISTFFIYYNKTLFQENGIEDPYKLYQQGKWDFAKFRETAKKATLYEKDNTTVKCYGFATWYRELFVLANGGNIIAPDGKGRYVSAVDTPNALAGLNLLKDLCKDGSCDASMGGYTEFKSRKVAMLAERPWNAIGQYDYYKTMKDEIGVVPVPKGPNADKVYAPSNTTASYVPAKCKNPVGGMAWNYFSLRRSIEGEKQNHPDAVEFRRKSMSDEHKAIIDAYLKNATQVTSRLDSLSGWSNYSVEFWGGLVSEFKPAEEMAASMKSILDSSIIRTIGK